MKYPMTSKFFALSVSKRLPKYLIREEVHQILSIIKKPRDRMILDFLWNTGVRVSELISIKVSSIDFYAGVINVRTLKKRYDAERSIPVPKDFLNKVDEYIQSNKLSGDDFLFPITRQNIYYLVSRYCRIAGIDYKRRHPHTFRHSFAINCVLQGISGSVLAEWLGHEGLAHIMVYARALARDTKHLRDGLEF